jgi:hypothetical protein
MLGGLQNEPVPPKAWGSGGEAPGLDIIVNIDIDIDIDIQC